MYYNFYLSFSDWDGLITREFSRKCLMIERLSSVPMEEAVGGPASVESPFKMWRPRKSYTVAYKAYSQEREESSSEQSMGGFGINPKYQGHDSQGRGSEQHELQAL
jgi:hypothetical protein